MRVKCYWNLNKAKQGEYVFSIVNLADGKVDGYASDIAILNAKFHVGTKARLKIAGGEKKSVHAWVTGEKLGTTSPLVVLKAINKRGVVFYKG